MFDYFCTNHLMSCTQSDGWTQSYYGIVSWLLSVDAYEFWTVVGKTVGGSILLLIVARWTARHYLFH